MKTIPCEESSKVRKNKKKIEKVLDVEIKFEENKILISGKPEDEYIAEKVIEAINFGFPLSVAFLIKKEDFMFEIIKIKDHTKRKNMQIIRARIIGTKGKTLRTLSELTKCHFEIKDNKIGIIGSPLCIQNAQNAIIQIIQGAKQSNVYSFLEKHQPKPIFDLGLKDKTFKERI